MMHSGLCEATASTSLAAAEAIKETADTLRERLYKEIHESGWVGRTDYESQQILGMKGNTQRPRRMELWEAGRIRPATDLKGKSVRRPTDSGKGAVVWVSCLAVDGRLGPKLEREGHDGD